MCEKQHVLTAFCGVWLARGKPKLCGQGHGLAALDWGWVLGTSQNVAMGHALAALAWSQVPGMCENQSCVRHFVGLGLPGVSQNEARAMLLEQLFGAGCWGCATIIQFLSKLLGWVCPGHAKILPGLCLLQHLFLGRVPGCAKTMCFMALVDAGCGSECAGPANNYPSRAPWGVRGASCF